MTVIVSGLESNMRKVLLVILFMFFVSTFAQKPSVQLILDVSGSMWLNLESGDTKIDAAKTVLIDFIGGLPSDSLNMGLRLYGATVSGIDPQSCTDSQLIIPVDGLDKGGLINTVQSTDPKGGTPIVYALNEAIKDFDTVANDAQKLIILVTDGAESCGEDLDAAVQAVKANGIDLQVIGFGLAEKAANTFESTGAFANAMSALELATVLQETTQEITVVPEVATQPKPPLIVQVEIEQEPIIEEDNSIVEKQSRLVSLAEYEYIITPKRYYTNLLDLEDGEIVFPDETGTQLSNGEVVRYSSNTQKDKDYNIEIEQFAAEDTTEFVSWPTGKNIIGAVFEFEEEVNISRIVLSFSRSEYAEAKLDINDRSFQVVETYDYMKNSEWRQNLEYLVNIQTDEVTISGTAYDYPFIVDEIIFIGSTEFDSNIELDYFPQAISPINYVEQGSSIIEAQNDFLDLESNEYIIQTEGYWANQGYREKYSDKTGVQLSNGKISSTQPTLSDFNNHEWVVWYSEKLSQPRLWFAFEEGVDIRKIYIRFAVNRSENYKLPKEFRFNLNIKDSTYPVTSDAYKLLGGEISDGTNGFIEFDLGRDYSGFDTSQYDYTSMLLYFDDLSEKSFLAIDEIIFVGQR